MKPEKGAIYTVGHSNHGINDFLALLLQHGITALADVRSRPWSRHVPHFSQEALKAAVTGAGMAYVFLGKELGARPDDPDCYVGGKVSYARLAQRPVFADGIRRLLDGRERFRIALMCAEKDPADCHRAHLVAPALVQAGVAVLHIHADGHLESHENWQQRVAPGEAPGEPDLFS